MSYCASTLSWRTMLIDANVRINQKPQNFEHTHPRPVKLHTTLRVLKSLLARKWCLQFVLHAFGD